MTNARCTLALVAGLVGAIPAFAQVRGQAHVADALLEQFDRTPLVALAEQHRSRQVHHFLRQLIADPKFSEKVNDIVVEFGSAHYQSLIDRYVSGEDLPLDEVSEAWRGSGQWLVWDSPLYEQFFAAVRRRNAGHARNKQVRVLLGDPPLYWPDVHSAEDYRRFAERDAHFAEVVEREVLAKHRRALLIAGGMHLQRRGPLDPKMAAQRPGIAELLLRHHPQALFVVWTLPASAEIARQLGLRAPPAFLPLRGSPLQKESFARLVPKGIMIRRVVDNVAQWVPLGEVAWPPMCEVVDALLYLGTDGAHVDPDPAIYREPKYQAELRRRAAILKEVYGFDFLPELESLLKDTSPARK